MSNVPVNKKRVACYIDGFNFYHAVKELGRDHLTDLLTPEESPWRCPQNLIARMGNPCRPECLPQPDDQNKGCPAPPVPTP